MKKLLFLTVALSVLLTACGSSAAFSDAAEAEAVSPEVSSLEEQETLTWVDMLYYKKLSDTSIMAACYTEEGIAWLGEDYYVIHVGEATISNAQGEIMLDDLTRGCPVSIGFSGMVMESYPGQISASEVHAQSDEADPRVPPEDEIEPINGGPKWWVEEPVTEIPTLELGYESSEFTVTMLVEHRYGSWNYAEESSSDEETIVAGAANTMLDGQYPVDWNYDDNNTIKRSGFDTVRLSTTPMAEEMTVTAYAAAQTEDAGIPLELDEQGNLTLLDGEYVYVVSAVWNSEQYQGEATYGFLVTER